ncbi:hypothetical protein AGLY_016597 [Aphis glycines]|uniref:Double jelly roll-like domain-containing protein n=1 Tax=Aphis glycines TaxID=307491 RepID=A0A6G0SX66_APHGL|nr:hypothetical protein AGLY_016597 [Aphis glycines]
MDDFLGIKDAKLFFYGRYLQKDGKDYPKDSKIQLIDNFPAFLVSRFEVKKHGKVLDEIENVGVASTIKGVLSFSVDPNGPIINSGFSSKYKGGGRFNVMVKLSQLGLGWFKDQIYPVFKGDMEINLTRNTNDDALLKKIVIGTEDGKIIIDELLLKIPIIEYNPMYKVLLLNELPRISQEKKYTFNFKSWQCIEERNISGKNIKLGLTTQYRSLNSPLFAGVVFQTNKLNTQEHDPCEFDHCNVKNFRFEINGRRYPEETQDLDFKNEKYCEAYDSLMEYKKTFHKTHQELPLMYNDPNDFKTFRAIYLVNMTRQPTNISATKQNIILHVDFNKDLPKNTICYVFFVRNDEFLFDIEKGTIEESLTGYIRNINY